MSGQDPPYTCFNTERPSEKRFSDGLCRLSRVCRPRGDARGLCRITHPKSSRKPPTAHVAAPYTLRRGRLKAYLVGRAFMPDVFYNETKQEIRIIAGVGWVLTHHSHAVFRAWWVETHPTLTAEAVPLSGRPLAVSPYRADIGG